MDRETVQQIATCPACGAQPGEPCQGRRGPRTQLHQRRWDAAETAWEGREHEVRWWWVIAQRPGTCGNCGHSFNPGEVIAYRQAGAVVICEACVARKGIKPLVSEAYMRQRR
jgi:hypothetical protein